MPRSDEELISTLEKCIEHPNTEWDFRVLCEYMIGLIRARSVSPGRNREQTRSEDEGRPRK